MGTEADDLKRRLELTEKALLETQQRLREQEALVQHYQERAQAFLDTFAEVQAALTRVR